MVPNVRVVLLPIQENPVHIHFQIFPLIYLLHRYIPLHRVWKMLIASLSGLILVYAVGTTFMCLYLSWGIPQTLLVAVVPYLPFDAAKIILAILVMLGLPESVKPKEKKEEK